MPPKNYCVFLVQKCIDVILKLKKKIFREKSWLYTCRSRTNHADVDCSLTHSYVFTLSVHQKASFQLKADFRIIAKYADLANILLQS